MLSKRRRLARADFPALLRSGRVLSFGSFSVRYRRSISGKPRVSVVVSKKVARTAVRRNRLRRRVYHAIGALSKKGEFSGAWDMVIFAKAPAEHLSSQALHRELRLIGAKAESAA